MVRSHQDSFRHMSRLFKIWLKGARYRQILRLLDLIQEELSHRGYTLSCAVHRKHLKKTPGRLASAPSPKRARILQHYRWWPN